MESEDIRMNISSVKKVITLLRLAGIDVTTVNIIKALTGGYLINFGIPPALSSNAHAGKFLRKNSSVLGIRYTGSKKVKLGNSWTTTAVWD
ncbi:MAG: hypothetical protein ACOX6E_02885 [Syntrophomonadaceae bacterium]|jgi:hypothetical protein